VPGLLPAVLSASVSDGDVLTAGVALLICLLGVLLAANQRWNSRLEETVKDHARTAKADTKVVADAVVDVRLAQAETNRRLHDTRERLAGIESLAEFLITRQSTVAKTTLETHAAVVGVAHQLETDNGLTVGQFADRTEGRRLRDLPEGSRTDDEQDYVDRLDAVEHHPGES
jgi:hypothetical protein